MGDRRARFQTEGEIEPDISNPTDDVDKYVEHRRRSIGFNDFKLLECIRRRSQHTVTFNGVNATPKNLGNTDIRSVAEFNMDEQLRQYTDLVDRNSRVSYILHKSISSLKENQITKSIVSLNVEIDDIIQQIVTSETLSLDDLTHLIQGEYDLNDYSDVEDAQQLTQLQESDEYEKKSQQFIRIVLRQTDDILLYEQNNVTILRDSNEDEYRLIEDDNKLYENLTVGKGKNRLMISTETQTFNNLRISRGMNTIKIDKQNIDTFVSNYDIYDTYEEAKSMSPLMYNAVKNINSTAIASKTTVEEIFSKNDQFKTSSMIIERLLAGNIFRERQRRYRNMISLDPLDSSIKYLYRLDTLWECKTLDTIGKSVTSISLCPTHPDLIAIGYGTYEFQPFSKRPNGFVCIWNCKNPINPERRYRFTLPVTCVSFSKQSPQLIAIGLYNGVIEIIDITKIYEKPVAKTKKSNLHSFGIWHIEWIQINRFVSTEDDTTITNNNNNNNNNNAPVDQEETAESTIEGSKYPNEELLIVSQNGLIIKSTIVNGPYLLDFRQMKLDRVIEPINGIPKDVNIEKIKLDANRHPQALTLQIHPIKTDIYFIGTDEGCLHKCSIFYRHQHTSVSRVHNGCVACMEYSPFSPRIYLTCGTDFCTRIWIEDISEPIIELKSNFESLHSASWNPKHSTIIVCVTKTKIEIWDIRRTTLKPCSITTFGSTNNTLTTCKFTKCGKSIIIGDSNGNVYMYALEDMPIPPHFQYDALQSAIYRNLSTKPDLQQHVKNLGYLGY